MDQRLKVLLLEDVITDADLVRIELQRAALLCEVLQVKTETDFRDGLRAFNPEIILADYWLPGFDGISALEIARELRPRLPFIFVSGAIGEDLATETLRRGATDYVSKDHLSRLGPAVRRALAERDEKDRRMLAEAALRASEEKYRMVFASAAGIIFVLDRSRAVTDLNPRAENALGYPAAEIIGRDFLHLAHEEDRPGLAAALERLGAGPVSHEFQIQGLDRVLEVTLNASTVPAGPARAIVILDDVTEKKRLQRMVQQAQKLEAIGRLAGGVAHDFNNLLTVVENCCERLLTTLASSDRRREDVTEIRHAGNLAATLTRRLLAFGNRDVVQPERLELTDLIRQLLPFLKKMVAPQVQVRSELADGNLWVDADRGQVEQVLLNLVANARDAMPEGGSLTLQLEEMVCRDDAARELGLPSGHYARLRVTDTGPGIPDRDQRHIFEPFFTTKGGGSAGLGLSTIYGIVRQADGAIRFRSESGGTTFEVNLPLREAPGEPAMEIDDFSGTETVLVVEDEEVVRRVVRLILAPWGYRVIEACNGEEALAVWDREGDGIGLVITDIVMPGMSGRELVRRLAERRPGLLSLFISGHAEELAGRRGSEEEFNFLYKPFSSEAMLKKVRGLLDRPI